MTGPSEHMGMVAKFSKFCEVFTHFLKMSTSKGQLISKCLYEVVIWTKIPTKRFDNFCPERARAEIIKNFIGILVQTMIS